jgi:glycerol-1-phosphate dehydrogenase [NAD(P)+]
VSVDAFVTPQAGLRRKGIVEYVGQTSPDPLVIDYDLLRTAPPELNIGGVGDLLSIHTACFDWELAHRAGADEHDFSPDDVRRARAILRTVSRHAGDIRTLTDRGLRTIVEGYMSVNTICLPAGHYRVEEGSEHYLFYELEARLRRTFLHGPVVGLGIYIMSRLQNNHADQVTQLMDYLGLTYQPEQLGISEADLALSIKSLRGFVEKKRLWYTVINERSVTDDVIGEVTRGLRF